MGGQSLKKKTSILRIHGNKTDHEIGELTAELVLEDGFHLKWHMLTVIHLGELETDIGIMFTLTLVSRKKRLMRNSAYRFLILLHVECTSRKVMYEPESVR